MAAEATLAKLPPKERVPWLSRLCRTAGGALAPEVKARLARLGIALMEDPRIHTVAYVDAFFGCMTLPPKLLGALLPRLIHAMEKKRHGSDYAFLGRRLREHLSALAASDDPFTVALEFVREGFRRLSG